MSALAPVVLHHGERFFALTVLERLSNGKYRCGCSCGYSRVLARANALMRGRVKACKKCAALPSCKEET